MMIQMFVYVKRRGQEGIEPSPTLRENHTTRPLARGCCQYNLSGIMAEWLRRWT